jgi:glycerol uptake facilitator protein
LYNSEVAHKAGIPDFIGGILGALFWDHVLKPYIKFVKNIK